MHEDKRRELEARRRDMNARRKDAERQQAWRDRCSDVQRLVDFLEAKGEDYRLEDSRDDTSWQPGWIPCGSHDFLWHMVKCEAKLDHAREPKCRADAIVQLVSLTARPDEEVVVVFQEPWLTFRFTGAVLERSSRHVTGTSPFPTDEIWIAHPSGSWIIRSEEDCTTLFREH